MAKVLGNGESFVIYIWKKTRELSVLKVNLCFYVDEHMRPTVDCKYWLFGSIGQENFQQDGILQKMVRYVLLAYYKFHI